MRGIGVCGKNTNLCGCGDDVGGVNGVGVFAWNARFPGALRWGVLMVRRVGTCGEGGGA